MQFDRDIIIEYATKAMSKEIEECYSTIRMGEEILAERKNGAFNLGKNKTTNEVREIIDKNKSKIEKIYKIKEDLIFANEIDELELVKGLNELIVEK